MHFSFLVQIIFDLVRHCTALYGTVRHNSGAHYGGTLLETLVVFLRSELGGNLRTEIQRNFFLSPYGRVLNILTFFLISSCSQHRDFFRNLVVHRGTP
jgi:hypothetical protein